jgi:hypothetical protein
MNRTFSPSYLINPDLRFQVDYPLEFPRIGGWKTQKPHAIVMNVEIIRGYRGRDSDPSGEARAPNYQVPALDFRALTSAISPRFRPLSL